MMRAWRVGRFPDDVWIVPRASAELPALAEALSPEAAAWRAADWFSDDAPERRALQQASVIGHVHWDSTLRHLDEDAGRRLAALTRRERGVGPPRGWGQIASASVGTGPRRYSSAPSAVSATQGRLARMRSDQAWES